MKRQEPLVIIGELMVIVGVLLLMQLFGVYAALHTLVWSILFLVGGAAFLGVSVRTPERWWALIPGFVLLSLGALTSLDWFAPALGARWGGTLFLCGLSLAFWCIYLLRRAWWAIIPGGVLVTLGAVAALPSAGEERTAMLLFSGIGFTFLLVALVPPYTPRRNWAFIPALLAMAVSLMSLTATLGLMTIVWSVVLIGGGIFLLYYSLHSDTRKGSEL